MKLAKGAVDISILISLLLITQSSLPIKFIGLVFLIVVRPIKYVKLKVHPILFFYLAMFTLAALCGLFYVGRENYFIPYFLVLIFWGCAYIILAHLISFIKENETTTIAYTLKAYFVINALVSGANYVSAVLNYNAFNIYEATPAAGDLITGIFPTSSVNMIICSMFLVYFLNNKWYLLATTALIITLLTGFMSGIILFIGSILLALFLYSNFPFSQKILIVFGTGVVIAFFYIFSLSNISYAYGYLDRVLRMENDAPFKIVSFIQTFEFWISSIKSFLIGAGPGNFSSRVAFTVSGEYVEWYPKQFEYVANTFKKNHLWIWMRDFGNIWDNRTGTANQPFSYYNLVIGEYGLVGLLLFLIFYVGYWFKRLRFLSFGKLILPMMLSYFILDYWLEYLSVVIIFEALMFYDLLHNPSHEQVATEPIV